MMALVRFEVYVKRIYNEHEMGHGSQKTGYWMLGVAMADIGSNFSNVRTIELV